MKNNFKLKPVFVTAYQFDGSPDSAKQIVKDLALAHPRYEYAQGGGFTFALDMYPGRAPVKPVSATEWVIQHENGVVQILTDVEHRNLYIPA